MKKYGIFFKFIAVIFLTLIVSCGTELESSKSDVLYYNECDCSDLEEREDQNSLSNNSEQYFRPNENKPFTGLCYEYWDNGRYKRVEQYSNGIKFGFESYFNTGTIKSIVRFADNQISHMTQFNEDGEIVFFATPNK